MTTTSVTRLVSTPQVPKHPFKGQTLVEFDADAALFWAYRDLGMSASSLDNLGFLGVLPWTLWTFYALGMHLRVHGICSQDLIVQVMRKLQSWFGLPAGLDAADWLELGANPPVGQHWIFYGLTTDRLWIRGRTNAGQLILESCNISLLRVEMLRELSVQNTIARDATVDAVQHVTIGDRSSITALTHTGTPEYLHRMVVAGHSVIGTLECRGQNWEDGTFLVIEGRGSGFLGVVRRDEIGKIYLTLTGQHLQCGSVVIRASRVRVCKTPSLASTVLSNFETAGAMDYYFALALLQDSESVTAVSWDSLHHTQRTQLNLACRAIHGVDLDPITHRVPVAGSPSFGGGAAEAVWEAAWEVPSGTDNNDILEMA